MFINFTLVIQACNFFIAYHLLRVVLFKPAVGALYEERQFKQNLQLHINAIQMLIFQHEEEKQDQQALFHKKASNHIPNAAQYDFFILKDISPQLPLKELNIQQLALLKQKLAQDIVKRLEDAYE